MSTSYESNQVGEGWALALARGPQPWYAVAPTAAPDREALEDEHTRVLSRAVRDHLPYELCAARGRARGAAAAHRVSELALARR